MTRLAGALRGLLVVLNDGLNCRRQKIEQEIGGIRCRTRGAQDGAVILTQHIQLGTDGVGVTNGRHDTKRGTNSGASYFGDPLFARV